MLKKRSRREFENEEAVIVSNSNGSKQKLIQTDISEENELSSGRWTESDHVVKKIDYDNLEQSLYVRQVNDYHDLMNHVNIWAVNLGFLVKLKRPPKVNQDGSKTLRVYCASFKKSKPLPDDVLDESQPCSANQSVAKSDVRPSQCSSSIKSERFECSSVSSHIRCCSFGLTFKADPATDCWLLYQEYSKEKMTHSHRLEQATYANIREYVQLYTDKVRSLTELKELIYEKFGLEYTLNQISYF